MPSNRSDIRKELEGIIAELQKQIDNLHRQKDKINNDLQEADSAMGALRKVYELEAKRFGEPSFPLFAGKGKSYRFAGMKVGEALTLLREEQPGITKKQALEILTKEGFDFRGKRPGSSVHFAWIALDRKGKKRK